MASSLSTSGLPTGVHVGATGPRLLAALVEVGPIWLLVDLALLFTFVFEGSIPLAGLFMLLALAWALLVWAQRATRAAGPGMRLDSLQIVGYSDGRPIGWRRVLLRWLVFAGLTVSVVGLIAMAVAMARHPRRQGWHDLAVDAVIIRERPIAPSRARSAVVRVSDRAVVGHSSAPASPAPSASSAAVTAVAADLAVARYDNPPVATPVAPGGAVVSNVPVEQPLLAMTVASDGSDQSGHRPDLEWWLRLDDGRQVGVAGLVLLGRNPQPRVGEEDAILIKVVDKSRRVSKSHLAVGVDARGLYAMDRGSTNGTTVTAPGGEQRPCPPGDLIDVPAGSVISFGDRWLEARCLGRQQAGEPREGTR